MADGLFNKFARDHRPLSIELHRRYGEAAAKLLVNLPMESEPGHDKQIATAIITQVQTSGPRIVATERADDREGEYRPDARPGYKVATRRYYVAHQIEGDEQLLQFWPDKAGTLLTPVDEERVAPARTVGPALVYDMHEELLHHDNMLNRDRWFLGYRTKGDEAQALFTFEDLTLEGAERVADGTYSLRELFDARRAAIEPILRAIEQQVAQYFSEELHAELLQSIAHRRRQHRARDAVIANLEWPAKWQPPPLALVDATANNVTAAAAAEHPLDVSINRRVRLSPTSFEQVLRTMRVWTDAVERYPDSYRDLHEDRLSDQLCAVLNATFPGAGREVYTRAGKADIVVRADVVNEGAGPARLFVCEAKWWSSRNKVTGALAQLFGYLEVKDTAAVLMFFIRSRDVATVHKAILDTLRSNSGFVTNQAAAVEGWPILRFTVEGLTVSICVVFVDLPPPIRSDNAGRRATGPRMRRL